MQIFRAYGNCFFTLASPGWQHRGIIAKIEYFYWQVIHHELGLVS
jgi:hypothetical protein